MASESQKDPQGPPPSTSSPPAPAGPAGVETGAEYHNVIEVDTDIVGRDDEGYQTDVRSAKSTSISSSVRDYVFENNRRYHKFKEGRYLIPNDDEEQEREDMKHALVLNLCGGKLHLAPFESPNKILDIGTGTGIWAIDSKFQ
jgi:hypothetical protein